MSAHALSYLAHYTVGISNTCNTSDTGAKSISSADIPFPSDCSVFVGNGADESPFLNEYRVQDMLGPNVADTRRTRLLDDQSWEYRV